MARRGKIYEREGVILDNKLQPTDRNLKMCQIRHTICQFADFSGQMQKPEIF